MTHGGARTGRRHQEPTSLQLPHHQPDTIVRSRTWNKMRQNGARFDHFRGSKTHLFCDNSWSVKNLQRCQILASSAISATLDCQVILHFLMHNGLPLLHLSRLLILDSLFRASWECLARPTGRPVGRHSRREAASL